MTKRILLCRTLLYLLLIFSPHGSPAQSPLDEPDALQSGKEWLLPDPVMRTWHKSADGKGEPPGVRGRVKKVAKFGALTFEKEDGGEITVRLGTLCSFDRAWISLQLCPQWQTDLQKLTARQHDAAPLTNEPRVTELWKHPSDRNRIEVEPPTGTVRFIRDGKELRTAKVTDPAYRTAVTSCKLDEFTGDKKFKADSRGNIGVPVVVTGYPLLGQQGGTCWKAYFREWLICMGGSRVRHDAPFEDLGRWIAACRLGRYDITLDDIRKEIGIHVRERGGKAEYRDRDMESDAMSAGHRVLHWIEMFLDIKCYTDEFPVDAETRGISRFAHGIHLPKWEEAMPAEQIPRLTAHLLLGHGVLSLTTRSKNMHLCAVTGTHDRKVFTSSWGQIHTGNTAGGAKTGEMSRDLVILVPSRRDDAHAKFFKSAPPAAPAPAAPPAPAEGDAPKMPETVPAPVQ